MASAWSGCQSASKTDPARDRRPIFARRNTASLYRQTFRAALKMALVVTTYLVDGASSASSRDAIGDQEGPIIANSRDAPPQHSRGLA